MPIYSSFQNGESNSKYEQGGFDALVCADIHAQIGTLQCQLALVSESTTPNEACVQATAADGTVYFFSTTSGKTWKRTTGGSYSLVNTNANGAHISAYYSASLNKILYTTSTKLGHLVASTDTFTDSFGTFSNGSIYHPIADVNLTAFVGDGKYIASVNQALTFSANALDIPVQRSVTCLKNERNWVLFGDILSTNNSVSTAYLWDSHSSSWTTEDDVYEIGINCFIASDNLTYAQCGTEGKIYYWSGERMIYYDQMSSATTSVGQEKVTVLKGKPLIAVGTRVYSLYKKTRNANDVLCHEYTGSATITSIGVTGGQLLAHVGTGVMKIDTNYATASVTTPLSYLSATNIEVLYETLNSGTLGLETNVNGAGWVTETGFKNDSINMRYFLEGGISYAGKVMFLQTRITLNPLTTTTPVIQDIIIHPLQ